jgi:hypothetical protein
MIMFEQSRRLSEPLRWGRREKTIVAVLAACVAAGLLALGGFALSSGAPARRDCVSLVFASTLGGAEVHACGERARRLCTSGGYPSVAQELRAECRRAGLPYAGP